MTDSSFTAVFLARASRKAKPNLPSRHAEAARSSSAPQAIAGPPFPYKESAAATRAQFGEIFCKESGPRVTNPSMQAFAIIGFIFGISALPLATAATKALKQQRTEIDALKAAVDELRARLGRNA